MPGVHDVKTDPRLAGLDASGTIDLCQSLADYAEAGGLSRELMLQVGRYAENRYGDSADVLLSAARMYLHGGEAARALEVLFRAARLGPDEARVRPLLDAVLKKLGDPRSPAQALRDATPPPMSFRGDPNPRSQPGLPTVKEGAQLRSVPTASPEARQAPPTVPPARRTVPPASRATPAGGAKTPRSAERTKTVPKQRLVPGTIQARAAATPPKRPSAARGWVSLDARGAATARAPVETSSAHAEIRTEVSRRQAREAAGSTPPESADRAAPSPADRLPVWAPGAPRARRIRLLEPDDDRRLDPYELIGEIASGGMATVYLGRLAGAGGFQRLVAIKRLHPHLAREQQFVDMFLDEARLAARIHHPHVVPILEVGQSPAGYYLVMEFVEGDTLSGLTIRSLQRGAILPPPAALRIVLDALAGLHAAHLLMGDDNRPLGLVHRDCTPQNILVGVDGSARITDFGVARAAARITITATHQVKGKVGYLSPEQSQAHEIDRRSDIFTMGIVLWEALAGRPLFQGDTEAVTLSRLLSAPIPSIRSFVPDIPPALDEVCQRALQRDRSQRFRTAAEMAEAIERASRAEGFVGVASPRDLGRFVEGLLGAELVAQREAIRSWTAENEPAPRSRASYALGGTPSSRTSALPPEPTSPRPLSQTAPDRPSLPDLPPAEPAKAEPARPAASSEPTTRPSNRPPAAEDRTSAVPAPPPEPAKPAAEAPKPAAPDVEKTAPSAAAPAEIVARETAKEAPAAPGPRPAAPSLLARLASLKLSTRAGLVLVAVVVLLATAPIWVRRVMHLRGRSAGHAAASARPRAGKAPRAEQGADTPDPAPKPTSNGWSDKDWGENGQGEDKPGEDKE
jgi:serine/threonine-protein kinase